ncbi:hypothetical protein D3C71_1269440 [compost metagenome]
MSDTVMQGFQNHPGVVLVDFDGQQLVLRKQLLRNVPDALQHLRRCQQERGAEMFICLLLSDKLPGDLRRWQEVRGFALAQQKQSRMCDASLDGYPGFVEEGWHIPGCNFGGKAPVPILLGELLAGYIDGRRVKVIQRCAVDRQG